MNQMKLSKLKEKFIICKGCHTTSTINFTEKDIEKTLTCPKCGKITTYILNKKTHTKKHT